MTFETIMRLITDAGIGVVCAGVIVFLFYKIIMKEMKAAEELRKSSEEQNKEMLKHILEYTPYSITPKKYEETVSIDKDIDEILCKLRDTTKSSRTFLVTFHNGGKDLSGLSFLKMSMRNEVCAEGIKSIQSEFQNIFRSNMAYWCNELTDKGYCYIDNIEDLKNVDNCLYDFLSIRNIKSKYGIAVNNNDGHIIGFLCTEYVSEREVSLDQIEHCLNDKRNKIEALLNFANHNDNVK